jgi:hypothetical protein
MFYTHIQCYCAERCLNFNIYDSDKKTQKDSTAQIKYSLRLKRSKVTGNRTSDLLACSIVPQQTALPFPLPDEDLEGGGSGMSRLECPYQEVKTI